MALGSAVLMVTSLRSGVVGGESVSCGAIAPTRCITVPTPGTNDQRRPHPGAARRARWVADDSARADARTADSAGGRLLAQWTNTGTRSFCGSAIARASKQQLEREGVRVAA